MILLPRRSRWQRQPESFTRVDLAHPLAWGFDNPRATFLVFNPGNVQHAYNNTTGDYYYDLSGNNNGGGANSTASPQLVTNAQGFGCTFAPGASDRWLLTPILIDATINAGGTVYWAQQPNTVFNPSVTNELWGCRTAGVPPEFGAQRFSDNNLYIGWNGSGTDARVSIANAAAYWAPGQINHWALTWTSGGKSQLFNNGVLIGTAANNAVVSAFSGGDLFAVGNGKETSSLQFDGQMLYFALSGRVHTRGMIESWADNPYQVFARPNRRAFFFARPTANVTLTTVPGTLVKTGQVATRSLGLVLATVPGSLVKTGQIAGITFARKFTTVPGSLVKTGQVATLTTNSKFTTVPGSIVKTGQIAGLTLQKFFATVPGSLVKTGQVASLIIVAPGGYSATTVPGTISKNGQVAALTLHNNFTTVPGNITKTGQVASLSISGPFAGTTVPGQLVKMGLAAALIISGPTPPGGGGSAQGGGGGWRPAGHGKAVNLDELDTFKKIKRQMGRGKSLAAALRDIDVDDNVTAGLPIPRAAGTISASEQSEIDEMGRRFQEAEYEAVMKLLKGIN